MDAKDLAYWQAQAESLFASDKFDEALVAFEKTVDLDVCFSAAWHGKGKALQKLGRYEQALSAQEQAIGLNPQLTDAWLWKGSALKSLGRNQEALSAYEQAISLDRSSAKAWHEKGNVLCDLGSPREALSAFDQVISLDPPSSPDGWHGKGNAFEILGSHDQAFFFYAQALSRDPRFIYSWHGKGNALVGLGRFEEALSAYDQAISLDQRFFQSWQGKGNALLMLRRYNEALSSFEQAIQISDCSCESWHGKGYALYALGQYRKAIDACEQAIRLNPRLPQTWHLKGNALLGLGRYEEALSANEEGIRIDPRSAFAWEGKGAALRGLSRGEEAIMAYEQALGFDPRSSNAWSGKGGALNQLGSNEEALSDIEQAISLDPRSAAAWHIKAIALNDLERHEKALLACENGFLACENGLDRDLYKIGLWNTKGHALRGLRRYNEALSAYEQAISLDPCLPHGWHGKGNVLGDLDRHEEALSAYQESARLDPTSPKPHSSIALLIFSAGQNAPLSRQQAKAHFLRSLYLKITHSSQPKPLNPVDLRCLEEFSVGPLLARRLLLNSPQTATTISNSALWEKTLATCDLPDYLLQMIEQEQAHELQQPNLLQKALVYFHFGDTFTASDLLRRSLTLDTKSPQAHYYLILSLDASLEPCETEKDHAQALAEEILQSPEGRSPVDLYYAGQILLNNEAPSSAFQAFSLSSPFLPSQYMAWFCLDETDPNRIKMIDAIFTAESRFLSEKKCRELMGPIQTDNVKARQLPEALETLQHLRYRSEVAPAIQAALSIPCIDEIAPSIRPLLASGGANGCSASRGGEDETSSWQINNAAKADLALARAADREERAEILHDDLAEYLDSIPPFTIPRTPGKKHWTFSLESS